LLEGSSRLPAQRWLRTIAGSAIGGSAGCNSLKREDSVDQHKFRIGQTISFRSSTRISDAPAGEYRVVGHRPPEGGEPLYRIKSDLERHERIARESELKWTH
jgi:hypothetical protein